MDRGGTPSTTITLLELEPAVLVGKNKPVSHNIPQERLSSCGHLVVGLVPTYWVRRRGCGSSYPSSLRAAGANYVLFKPMTVYNWSYLLLPLYLVGSRPKTQAPLESGRKR